ARDLDEVAPHSMLGAGRHLAQFRSHDKRVRPQPSIAENKRAISVPPARPLARRLELNFPAPGELPRLDVGLEHHLESRRARPLNLRRDGGVIRGTFDVCPLLLTFDDESNPIRAYRAQTHIVYLRPGSDVKTSKFITHAAYYSGISQPGLAPPSARFKNSSCAVTRRVQLHKAVFGKVLEH